nr:protein IN2-1 homolog B-like isoform X2 [Quercus suber]
MAGLKVSFSCSNNTTASSFQNPSVPFFLSSFCKKVVTQNRFPNTMISPSKLQLQALVNARAKVLFSAKMAAGTVNEVLPPLLDSSSEPPPVFDGTTRLYMSYICPYAQRVWIIRNCKGLQDKIKLVPIDLENRPAWYKEKVYSANKVPSLEHNNEVRGESLDLIKYIDSHFEGPSLFPYDPDKKEFAEELLYYADTFNRAVISSFKGDGIGNEAGAAFDYIETALSKFEDGPFFLGQFSLVDIAYAPFIERFHPFFLDVKKYDIIAGRPKLADWIKEMDKNDAYKQTKGEPKELVDVLKKRFLAQT